MQTTDLKDLREAVERVRNEQHPHLDLEFLHAVIRAEDENPEDDTAALREIQTALKTALSSAGA
ncbi:hypothetical protein [Actinoplanes sp. HUAS TT8]|uniref:hypothetical protein n=1 Tax=Actinoplanes sp. HUAS TT8 TaxID=3447453 RepID=UPI003F51CE95